MCACLHVHRNCWCNYSGVKVNLTPSCIIAYIYTNGWILIASSCPIWRTIFMIFGMSFQENALGNYYREYITNAMLKKKCNLTLLASVSWTIKATKRNFFQYMEIQVIEMKTYRRWAECLNKKWKTEDPVLFHCNGVPELMIHGTKKPGHAVTERAEPPNNIMCILDLCG